MPRKTQRIGSIDCDDQYSLYLTDSSGHIIAIVKPMTPGQPGFSDYELPLTDVQPLFDTINRHLLGKEILLDIQRDMPDISAAVRFGSKP